MSAHFSDCDSAELGLCCHVITAIFVDSMFYTPPSAMRRSQTTSNIPPNSTDQDTNPVVEQYLQSMNDQHSNATPRPRVRTHS